MSKKNNGIFINTIERERHRVAASITKEQDWEQPEPNSGLARMFVIMLLIHVFVIGGIIIYDFVGGDPAPRSSQASGSVASTRASSNSTAANASSAAPLPTIASTSSNSSSESPAAEPAAVAPAPKTPTLSVPETAATPKTPMPKALPFTGSPSPVVTESSSQAGSATHSPLVIAHANTFDPIAFKSDGDTHSAKAGSVIETPTTEPAKERSQPEKAKTFTESVKNASDKTKAAAEKTKVADKPASSSQPHPVATPSAMRKALAGDSKPPAAAPTARKKDKEESAPPAAKKAAPKTPATRKYTIAKGDTIYSLARKYKVSEDSIMKANNIKKANNLSLGKVITIPAAK